MTRARSHEPHRPNHDVPEEFEPGAPPVEPDEGAVPAQIPDDAEHERVVGPGPNQVRLAKRTRGQVEVNPPLRAVKAPKSAAGMALPHERDQSKNTTAKAPDPVVVQAKRDIDAGLVDTDMRATPGLSAKRRARLVPGPGGKPPSADS